MSCGLVTVDCDTAGTKRIMNHEILLICSLLRLYLPPLEGKLQDVLCTPPDRPVPARLR